MLDLQKFYSVYLLEMTNNRHFESNLLPQAWEFLKGF